MDIPKGARVCCAADLFEYDENKAINLRKFFSFYKDKFPMLMVMIGGHYGDTKFDCYDNLQVLRIHCYTSQPRIISDDTRMNPAARVGFITIPEDTRQKFSVVKGHTKLGNPQKLQEILKEHEKLPLLLKFACDPQSPIRVGMSRHVARDFGNLFIRERFMEHFFIMNSIDSVDLNMNKLTCMACLSEDLDATPVTGFKYKSKAEFDEFCRKLSEDAAGSGEVYDKTSGNTDFSEYSFDDMRRLLDISEFKTGTLTDVIETDIADQEDDEYEEFPPLPPPRDLPRDAARQPSVQQKADTKQQSKPVVASQPKHTKLPKAKDKDKESKGAFGFFKKLIGEHTEHDGGVKQKTVETVKANVFAHKTHAVEPTSPKSPPKLPPHIAIKSSGSNQSHITDNDKQKEYVTLATHSGYQNTQIGRATIKPMPRATVTEECGEDNLKKETEEDDDDQGDYEIVDEEQIPKGLVPTPRVVQNKKNPILSELQQSIESQNINLKDTVGEEYEDMEVRKKTSLDTEDYLVPKPADFQSKTPAFKEKDESHSFVNQSQKRSDTQVHAKEEQNAEETSVFDVTTLSIMDISKKLTELKLGKYADVFENNQVDGEILASLSVDDFVNELGLKKLEAIRLYKFAESGHIPR